ncbi:unnamed protein product [Menidia menidia]|uniref:(Atlantic silverside) hypothetical protein n=1 Tax=Menidia menidia TaxID=238744 RepID=A0A8S4BCS2_9TELE|nr:unnamed protein product [Menidia menidia]
MITSNLSVYVVVNLNNCLTLPICAESCGGLAAGEEATEAGQGRAERPGPGPGPKPRSRRRPRVLFSQAQGGQQHHLHPPPPPRRVAVPVLVRDGKPCLGGTQGYAAGGGAAAYGSGPYGYGGYPAYSYGGGGAPPAYNSNYSCTYSGIPALPPTGNPNAFVSVNLGNAGGLGGSAPAQAHQATAVTSCQGSLQGIRAW